MNASAPARFQSLDALRGLLALGVAVYHLSVWFGLTPSGSFSNMALAKAGNYSVSAFFVLTGFLLARTAPWASIAKQGLGPWAQKRLLRLAPLFWIAVSVDLAFGLGMGPTPNARFIVENYTLTFGLFHPNHALVTGGWYVGVAVLAYVAWPLVAWLMEKAGAWVLSLLFAGLLAWSLPSTLHGVMAEEQWNRFHVYVLPGNQLFLVALGALGGWAHRRIEGRLGHRTFLLATGLVVWAIFRPFPWFGDHLAILTGPLRYRYLLLVSLLVLLAAFHRGWPDAGPAEPGNLNVARWMKPMVLLGSWSYGIYLAHPFLQRLVAPHVAGWTGLLLALGGSILVAAAAERWVEQPLSRWLSR
ncbi:MAG: acyltransferase [Acidobacteria bacterium]|nr:acyltransferase [Acidobacteriota bacterium]